MTDLPPGMDVPIAMSPRVAPTLSSTRRANVVLCLVAILGAVVTVAAFYPGWMTPDSVGQYGDARADIYDNWSPVLLAWWWRQLDRLHTGPALMLVQNALFYWAAFASIAIATAQRSRSIALLSLLAGFWPGTLLVVGTIWKDVAFGTSQFLAYALLFAVHATHRRPQRS